MDKGFLLCNLYDGRQYGIFPHLEYAKGEALDVFHRSRIKERYLLWHIVEFQVIEGVRRMTAEYFFKIESFVCPRDGIAC